MKITYFTNIRLTLLALLGATLTSGAVDPAKVIFIKADDFWKEGTGWADFLAASRSVNVKVGLGCIASRVSSTSTHQWMQQQEAMGDVEFWNHGWDHAMWDEYTTNGTTIVTNQMKEFSGSGIDHQRDHMNWTQDGMKTMTGHFPTTLGTPYNAMDSDTYTVLNEHPEIKLVFTYSTGTLAYNCPDKQGAKIISEMDGVGKPNFTSFTNSYPNGPTGPVSLQFHPSSSNWDATRMAAYTNMITFLQNKGFSIMLPKEYLQMVESPLEVIYAADVNGSITGTTTQSVAYTASSTSVTATPNSGYHFEQWSDGRTENPRTDQNVISNITVTAQFALNANYTLSYLAGPNGTLSGTTNQVVEYGFSGTAVTAVPDGGFRFDLWSDGISDNPRTDIATSNFTVTALFTSTSTPITVTNSAPLMAEGIIRGGSLSTNAQQIYSSEIPIKDSSNPYYQRIGMLRFDLSSVTGSVYNAELKITAQNKTATGATDAIIYFYALTDVEDKGWGWTGHYTGTLTWDEVTTRGLFSPTANFQTSPSNTLTEIGSVALTSTAVDIPVSITNNTALNTILDNDTNGVLTIVAVALQPTSEGDNLLLRRNAELTVEIEEPQTGSGYNSWATSITAGPTGRTDDADGDGINNLLEYALDLDPNGIDTSGLPTATLQNNTNVLYVFNSERSDISYQVKICNDLTFPNSWRNADASVIGALGATTTRNIPLTEMGTNHTLFIRLNAEETP